eukprot:3579103-Rhodomonas_salina.3
MNRLRLTQGRQVNDAAAWTQGAGGSDDDRDDLAQDDARHHDRLCPAGVHFAGERPSPLRS